MFALNTANSDAACSVKLNPLTATAEVWFWAGGPYTYRNVSRLAIVEAIAENALFGNVGSVGRWIHENLTSR